MTVEYTLLALAVPALLAAAGFAVWTRLRTRRMLDTLGKMLDDAIRGEFRESLYDESRLSALETRMAHYLSASAVSAKNLAEEKDAIKTQWVECFPDSEKALHCVRCGKCESVCPQKLPIRNALAQLQTELDAL